MAAVVSKLDLDRISGDLARLSRERETTRLELLRALRLVESKVAEALHGGTLRGMLNLAPPWHSKPYYAQRVREPGEGVRFRGLPKGHPVLVISKRGAIVLARVVSDNVVDERGVDDEELLIEDFDPIVRAYADAVERHVEHVERTSEARERSTALARTIVEALRR